MLEIGIIVMFQFQFQEEEVKYQSIPWNIYFNLRKKPIGTSVLRVSVAVNSSTALSVSINGGKNSAEVANFKDDACVRRDDIRGFEGSIVN